MFFFDGEGAIQRSIEQYVWESSLGVDLMGYVQQNELTSTI